MSPTRRNFIASTTLGSVAALTPSLSGLVARLISPEPGLGPKVRFADLGQGGYGKLIPAGDELELPIGFRYWILSEPHQPMSDGNLTPVAFDGMAAFPMTNGNIRLVRNHENRDTAAYSTVKGNHELAYDQRGGGGTTSLEVKIDSDGTPVLVRDFVSLSGTTINCAGGPTPWGSWLSCEETVVGPVDGFEKPHGYVYEVPSGSEEQVNAVPITAMGRFVHEAVAIDATTGIVYLTEDRSKAGFYRYLPNRPGELKAGGKLQMLRVTKRSNYDTRKDQKVGIILDCDWVDIADPNPTPKNGGDDHLVFNQGADLGAAVFARLEGCWAGDDGIFFHSTSGGNAEVGQVWFYKATDTKRGELALVFESPSEDILDSPDNLTVSPRGGVVMCEDGRGSDFVRGLTPTGEIFDLAHNIMNDSEFCGVCFSPDGKTLFVNVQGSTTDGGKSRGATFAIRGPWDKGAL